MTVSRRIVVGVGEERADGQRHLGDVAGEAVFDRRDRVAGAVPDRGFGEPAACVVFEVGDDAVRGARSARRSEFNSYLL